MASTQQISSERSTVAAISAKANTSNDTPTALDEFSRLIDDLVNLMGGARAKSATNALVTTEPAAIRETPKEKPVVVESAKVNSSDKAVVTTGNDSPETVENDESGTETAAPEGETENNQEATEATDVSAATVSVAAAQTVATPVTPYTAPEGEEVVAGGAPEGAPEEVPFEELPTGDLASQVTDQPQNAAVSAKKDKAAVAAATVAKPTSVSNEVETTATTKLPETAEGALAEALATRNASVESKSESAKGTAKGKGFDASDALNAAAAGAVRSGNDESVTGIILRHAFQAVSKALGIERAQLAQPQPTNNQPSIVQGLRASVGTDSDLRQAKLKPLPRQTAVRLMERVEQTLQEIARSKDGKSVSLKLDPPNLGTMRVDVTLRDGVLHARLTPESQQVASYLQEKAHELQSMLRKLGLNVDSVTVSVKSEEFTGAQGEQNSQGSGKNSLSSDGQSGPSGNNFPSSNAGFQNGGWDGSGTALEDHWVA